MHIAAARRILVEPNGCVEHVKLVCVCGMNESALNCTTSNHYILQISRLYTKIFSVK